MTCELYVARQALLSMGFSRQECWGGLPVPPPRDLPNPETEPTSPVSPALAGGSFTTEPSGKPKCFLYQSEIKIKFKCNSTFKLVYMANFMSYFTTKKVREKFKHFKSIILYTFPMLEIHHNTLL